MIRARSPATGVTRCAVFFPLKTLSVPGVSGRQRADVLVVAGEQTSNAVVVRIGVASEPAAILKRTARHRRLQKHGDGEFGPVEVPVEALARAISHDVEPAEGIGHRVEPRLLQRRRQEVDERLPFVDARDRAARNLVAADRVVDGRVPAERGVAGLQVLEFVVEVDVVIAGVGEGSGIEKRLNLRGASLERLGPDQPVETEHTGIPQRGPAAGDQRLPGFIVERVHRPKIEV